MIKGILIDFGGTIDSDGIHWFDAFREAYALVADVPHELLWDAYVHAERTLGSTPIITPAFSFRQTLQIKLFLQAEFLQSKGIIISDDAQSTMLNYCYNKVFHHISSTSKPVLEKLHAKYPMVLVTNFYGNMHTVLEEFGLLHLFKDIIESSVAGVRKPDPEIFRLGVNSLGLEPSETVMIGDNLDKDIIPAASIGCSTIWLNNTVGSDPTVQKISSLSEVETYIHI